ncbi:hypothetical protein FOA43_004167 [Brettanomyces nanus]|uniref:glucan 1,4-alpha-glucosidase n=1 Tax=Eeniella nana TaxID=13502 RepID=A0A875S783_EENNA|nr:uncharacterized protein FOA43_004167 [Brettanomyces nanus]QPG76773.1 hypothetical protein FOA43_004167 [Brettanomyces nanus]
MKNCLPLTQSVPTNYRQASLLVSHELKPQQDVTSPYPWLDSLAKFSPLQLGSYLIRSADQTWWSSLLLQLESSDSVITEGVRSLTSPTDENLELWLQKQRLKAFHGILDNVGGAGMSEQKGVSNGAVIASPSKTAPNYFYQWVRDAAITMNSLVEHLSDSNFEDSEYGLSTIIESYIANSYKLQRTGNHSGDFDTLSGLGEPKFMADSKPFTGSWGRPQRDGPGLRVITIANYMRTLDQYGRNFTNSETPSSEYVYENILKPDLSYIVKYWSSTGFDLWEEVDSLHLFTSLTQLKALKMGLEMAKKFGDNEFYKTLVVSFNSLRFFISVDSGFKPSSAPYLLETPSLVLEGRRCGLDIASILASLRSHDVDDTYDTVYIPFPVTDTAVMNTLTALINDMKYRYPINHGNLGLSVGFALGRYPEDVYNGRGLSEGNPWFISTATASELIYKLIYNLYNLQKDFIIPAEQASLFSSITTLKIKHSVTLPYGSNAFNVVTYSLLNYADTFLSVIKEHVDGDGHMSEQFNRYTGYMEGAEDLTWSYGSFWSSLRWRDKALQLLEENTQSTWATHI